MKHELNMMDYLDWIEDQETDPLGLLDKIIAQRDFLKSQPKLGDFVPTNEKGESMEKPSEIASFGQFEYQSALDRVLWKGWEYYPERKELYLNNKRMGYFTYLKVLVSPKGNKEFRTYEQLITSGIKLERIQRK